MAPADLCVLGRRARGKAVAADCGRYHRKTRWPSAPRNSGAKRWRLQVPQKQDRGINPRLHVKQSDLVEICDGEFIFPAGDYGAGQAVAGYVDGGACHVNEGVDAEHDEDGFGGEMERGRGCEKDYEDGAWNSRKTFAGEHEREHHDQLLRPGHVNACGLRYENGSQC